MNPAYHIAVFWSGEDGQWIADIPDLEDVLGLGGHAGGSGAEVQAALELWLDEARQTGRSIPGLALTARPPPRAEIGARLRICVSCL